jgi:hypothetical protein
MAEPADRGAPSSYLALAEGTPVLSSDGERIGEVKRVLAVPEDDIFDGLILDTDDGDRFVDAEHVAALFERAAVLDLLAADAEHLPEPTPSPAAMEATPDDVSDEGPGYELRRTLRSAWNRISGNY